MTIHDNEDADLDADLDAIYDHMWSLAEQVSEIGDVLGQSDLEEIERLIEQGFALIEEADEITAKITGCARAESSYIRSAFRVLVEACNYLPYAAWPEDMGINGYDSRSALNVYDFLAITPLGQYIYIERNGRHKVLWGQFDLDDEEVDE